MHQPAALQPMEWHRDGYTLSTDRARLDLDVVHAFLSGQSYWAQGVPRDVVSRALDNSLPFGLYAPDGELAGFARVLTDYAMFAYLRDVFVDPAHRGKGLATWMSRAMRDHPGLDSVTNWTLATADAHEVYRRAGYVLAEHPEWYMQVKREGWKRLAADQASGSGT